LIYDQNQSKKNKKTVSDASSATAAAIPAVASTVRNAEEQSACTSSTRGPKSFKFNNNENALQNYNHNFD
jgi:hypothetical protein